MRLATAWLLLGSSLMRSHVVLRFVSHSAFVADPWQSGTDPLLVQSIHGSAQAGSSGSVPVEANSLERVSAPDGGDPVRPPAM